MKFKALATIILYHESRMVVLNVGDKGDLPDSIVQPYIDAKQAVALKSKAAKADPAVEPQDADDDADDGAPVVDADAPPA